MNTNDETYCTCPSCGNEMKGASAVYREGGNLNPIDGDVTICTNCFEVLQLSGDWKPMTVKEFFCSTFEFRMMMEKTMAILPFVMERAKKRTNERPGLNS